MKGGFMALQRGQFCSSKLVSSISGSNSSLLSELFKGWNYVNSSILLSLFAREKWSHFLFVKTFLKC